MIKIKMASLDDVQKVFDITHSTINQVYPLYYPKGVVQFFHNHHKRLNIEKDIINEEVFLLYKCDVLIGTGTFHDNIEINRFFINSKEKRKGYGTILLKYLEDIAYEKTEIMKVDASLPGILFYLKHSYEVCSHRNYITENGDILYYPIMEKKIGKLKIEI